MPHPLKFLPSFMKLALGLACVAGTPAMAQEITLYSAREASLTVPILQRFTQQTGVRINHVAFKSADEIAKRLVEEGDQTRADLAMISDVGGLYDLVRQRLTQPVTSATLEAAIPADLRHPTGQWLGLSYRVRAIFVSRDRVPEPPTTYNGLTEPRFQGRVCIRSGNHPYNLALFGAMLMKEGVGQAGLYMQLLKGNLARAPAGGDRDVARDIAAKVCDVGIANTYYMGLMLSGAGGAEQKRWAEAVRVILPTFDDGSGAHMNISGASVMRHAPNRAGAIALLEYLVSEEAQKAFAEMNFEYPVRPGVPLHPILASFGTPKLSTNSLTSIANARPQVSRLVESAGFDRWPPQN